VQRPLLEPVVLLSNDASLKWRLRVPPKRQISYTKHGEDSTYSPVNLVMVQKVCHTRKDGVLTLLAQVDAMGTVTHITSIVGPFTLSVLLLIEQR
jgi:hypothetical protein